MRVFLRGLFELLTDTNEIHHQTARLVAENTVHTRNRLHQRVTFHGFVHVKGVQAGNVRAGQPHVAHDDDFERVLNVLHPGLDRFALRFRGDVPSLTPFRRVFAQVAGHDNLDFRAA